MAGVTVFSLVGIVGCGGADEPIDATDTSQSEDMLYAGRRLTEAQVALSLRGAGFPESVVPTMVCTAKYESSFYERAALKNKNGSVDRGVFQINSVHLGSPGCPKTGEELYSVGPNAACAHYVWKMQGVSAWFGYKKHKAECDDYVLAQ